MVFNSCYSSYSIGVIN